MAKIALLGYGKMGKEIEKIVLNSPHSIVAKIDNEADWTTQFSSFLQADVGIEFSHKDSVISNCRRCIENHIPVVVGTTGWSNQLTELIDYCQKYSGSLIYGSNFSIGANLFFKINKELAAIMNNQPQYEVYMEEIHHAGKKDAPSGTAITTAQAILSELERKKKWEIGEKSPETLSIEVNRVGDVAGKHTVIYESDEDEIIITHNAKNRSGFAMGALKAALWLVQQHQGIYNFQDIYNII